MKIGKVILSIIIIAVVFTAGLYIARKVCHATEIQSLTKKLNLSQEQLKEFNLLEMQYNADIKLLCNELQGEREQLNILIQTSKDLNNKTILNCLNRINVNQSKQQRVTVQYMLNIKKILDPDQQKIFFSVVSEELCSKCKRMGDEKCFCGKCE
ncbi:MAG: hypothetical protein PHE88_02240 [Elusimicrobia bacterium]|nr:hypothetical protein [Elusimicrobiota bacterium]